MVDSTRFQVNARKKYAPLLKEMTKKELVLKYRQTRLGGAWIFIEPLLSTLVYYFVFSKLYSRNDNTFMVYILIGRLFFSMFRSATTMAGNSVLRNQAMLKKFSVPKYIFPLSALFSQYIFFLISLLVLIPVCLLVGVYPSAYTWQFIVPLLLIFLLSMGVGYILATVETLLKDASYVWNVLLSLIMYGSAIFYEPSRVIREDNQWIFDYNPLYRIIEAARSCLMYRQPIQFELLKYPILESLLLLGLGLWLFHTYKNRFIMHL